MGKKICVVFLLLFLILCGCIKKADFIQQSLAMADFSVDEKREGLEKYFSKPAQKVFLIDPFAKNDWWYSWDYLSLNEAKKRYEKRRDLVVFAENNKIVYQDELRKYLQTPFGKGREYYHNHQYEKSIEQFKLDLLTRPDDHDALNYLGWAFFYMEKYDQAINYLRQSIAHEDEDYFSDHNGLTEALIMVKRYDEAYLSVRKMEKKYDSKHQRSTITFLKKLLILCGNYFDEEKSSLISGIPLGIRFSDYQPQGITVQTVFPNTQADFSGLMAGDIITRFNHRSLEGVTESEFQQTIKNLKSKKSIPLELIRDGKTYKGLLQQGITEEILAGTAQRSILTPAENYQQKTVAKTQQQPVFKRVVPVQQQTGKTTASLKKVALVIGNAHYTTSPLQNSINDARLLSSTLTRLGFQVLELFDANLRQINETVDRFYRQLKTADIGLLYYAGHGVQMEGENFLIPVSAQITSSSDIRYEAYPAGKIVDKMGEADNKTNIVILDACRNNPFRSFFRSGEQGLARMTAPTGTILIYSTAPGSVAADGNGSNGIFAMNFVRYLEEPGLDLHGILINTRREVIRQTQGAQVPWESSSLTDYFYFK